ncbi:hypothetical protein Pfo_027986 [Paulownia fortunei]|nr:hypothetical protein Pfo_027986 [Paulownia fortunei]
MKQLHQHFTALKLSGGHSVWTLNPRHILITLSNDLDFARLWLGRIWFVDGLPMRLFKWSPKFDPKLESAIVSMWIHLLELPVHLFDKPALKTVASLIGKPLWTDEATANKSRLNIAQICIEIDLREELKDSVYLGIGSRIFLQKIIYENLPSYCMDCKHLGHNSASCFENGNAPKPPK